MARSTHGSTASALPKCWAMAVASSGPMPGKPRAWRKRPKGILRDASICAITFPAEVAPIRSRDIRRSVLSA